MYIAALTVFCALMGVFIPTLITLYLQYSKEASAPVFIREYPYSIPVTSAILVLFLSLDFLIFAAIKEHRKKQKEKERAY